MDSKTLTRINILYWIGVAFLILVTAIQFVAFAVATYVTVPLLNAWAIPIHVLVLAFYLLAWSVVCDLLRVPFRMEAQNEQIKEHLEALRLAKNTR